MRDHMHRFEMVLFLTASALFGIGSMYASQFAPLLFAGSDRVQAETAKTPGAGPAFGPTSLSNGALKVNLSSSDAEPGLQPYTDESDVGKNAKPGDSVVPNAASCPATASASLSQPLAAQDSTARQALPQRPPIQSGAALGTGTGCPPSPSDAGPLSNTAAPKVQPGPNPGADIARTGALSGPAPNP